MCTLSRKSKALGDQTDNTPDIDNTPTENANGAAVLFMVSGGYSQWWLVLELGTAGAVAVHV